MEEPEVAGVVTFGVRASDRQDFVDVKLIKRAADSEGITLIELTMSIADARVWAADLLEAAERAEIPLVRS